ncbi:hypothetical protein DL96DRAFT_1711860 [Flagelloscypha sp. PMI_526]|nr:hypothetical protein DL96DRAFT_1711860 [Flagelloscypha sp. PMI_526]
MTASRVSARSYATDNDLAIQQSLEKEVRAMERKIKQLEREREEGVPYEGEPVYLHVPYRAMSHSPPPLTPSHEPTFDVKQNWLDALLQNSDQFGFFLHPTLFRQAALDEISGQTPFLRSCALLCGAAVSRAPNLALLLYKALKQRSTTLTSDSSPEAVLEHIQGEILLSRYFFYANKHLEAVYHASTAGALVVLGRLHTLGGILDPLSPVLIGDGERIRALWRAIEVELVLSIARQGSTHITGRTRELDNMTTPFPRRIREYEMGMFRGIPLEYPVQLFKQGNGTITPSQECEESLSAKSILLWYWSHINEQALTQRVDPSSVDFHQQWFSHLSVQIPNFAASLPTPSSDSPFSILNHTRARAAIIALHRSHAHQHQQSYQPQHHRQTTVHTNSHRTCIQASLDVFRLASLLPTTAGSASFVDGTFSLAWSSASDYLVQHNAMSSWDAQTVSIVRGGFSKMAVFEETCPRMKSQISKIRESLSERVQLV